MNRLRVCEVIKTLDPGGAEVLLAERLRLAPKTRTDYTVVFLRPSVADLADALRAAGITVVDLSATRRGLTYARLVATVIRLRPDVVHVHSPLPASVLRPCLRVIRRRPRLVSTVHSVSYRRLTLLADQLTIGLDDRTVAVSPLVARARTARRARRLDTRIHGVDVAAQRRWADRAPALRDEFDIPPGAFAIACVAGFRPVKNHLMLIRAAERVVRARPDALFLLAGDGPLREQVAREVDRRGIADRVRILGRVSQAGRLAACADLVVLSSRYEAMPVVIMEALAAGVPVVSTAVGGVPDLVRSGGNGILTEPGSAEALAEGILAAMAPDTHRRLRAGARDTDFADLSATAAWFEELYEELAGAAA
jgi:glycosyltransferase involved in cell wall biosynthesis